MTCNISGIELPRYLMIRLICFWSVWLLCIPKPWKCLGATSTTYICSFSLSEKRSGLGGFVSPTFFFGKALSVMVLYSLVEPKIFHIYHVSFYFLGATTCTIPFPSGGLSSTFCICLSIRYRNKQTKWTRKQSFECSTSNSMEEWTVICWRKLKSLKPCTRSASITTRFGFARQAYNTDTRTNAHRFNRTGIQDSKYTMRALTKLHTKFLFSYCTYRCQVKARCGCCYPFSEIYE